MVEENDHVAGEVPPTGDDRVDAAVARLAGLAGLPVAEHPAALAEVHRRLGEILGEAAPGNE